MTTITEQLELERSMTLRGAESYMTANARAMEQGRGADTTYGRKLMREFLLPLVDKLQEFLDSTGPAVGGKIRPLLRKIPAENSVYFALKVVFNSFVKAARPVEIATRIGKWVEDECRFIRFQEMHGDYYSKIVQDFKRKGTKDYRYMHRVLTHSANEQGDEWIAWSPRDRVDVGMKLLDLIMTGTDLLVKDTHYEANGHVTVMIEPSNTALAWIEKHEEFNKLLNPEKSPCIIPPDDWVSVDQGGYYSPELRAAVPLLKTYEAGHMKLVRKSDLSRVMEAVNTIQQTAWEVNQEVLSVAKAVWAQNLGIGMPHTEELKPPPSPVADKDKNSLTDAEASAFGEWKREASQVYTEERERRSRSFQTSRIIRLANQYAHYPAFWYVWYCDFRGRLYTATASFSPQGPDLAKGLVRFARGKPLGSRGLFWLRVHGANRFGNDKGSYEDRAQWVIDNERTFLQAADDPLSHKEVWANADKPYQFLAFLFEYRDALAAQALGVDFVSRLPVGLDGSCNGLQNFSAMLRDDVGGAATNLVPADKPADIYATVARVCTDKVRRLAATDLMAAEWIRFCDTHAGGSLPRSLAKRPVMTLPYGATRQSCTQYIFLSILETDRDFFDKNFAAACWLTPLLWESIGDVVVAARHAMQWLQASASAISKRNEPIIWYTPDGFPVMQATKKITSVKVETQLNGRFQVRIGSFTDKIDGIRQRLAVSPNFVHSMDATHLRETVHRAKTAGISSLALIHDDYGTHAGDTDKLHHCIREAFVEVYGNSDPLEDFKAVQDQRGIALPAIPARGTLDLERVRESQFFFG